MLRKTTVHGSKQTGAMKAEERTALKYHRKCLAKELAFGGLTFIEICQCGYGGGGAYNDILVILWG